MYLHYVKIVSSPGCPKEIVLLHLTDAKGLVTKNFKSQKSASQGVELPTLASLPNPGAQLSL